MLGRGNVQFTVYTKPQCPQCEQTQRWLTSKGIPFETRDVTTDPAALDEEGTDDRFQPRRSGCTGRGKQHDEQHPLAS